MKTFSHSFHVNLFHTDAAGILFYGRLFEFAQETGEMFLESVGMPLGDMIHGPDWICPIVHVEADYKKPMRVSDRIKAELIIEAIGTTSFTLRYTFTNLSGEVTAVAKTVQVCVNKNTMQKIPLPDEFMKKVEPYYLPS